jgi:hypothetical protein
VGLGDSVADAERAIGKVRVARGVCSCDEVKEPIKLETLSHSPNN